MFFAIERVDRILTDLADAMYTHKKAITDIQYKPCGYGCYDMVEEDSDGWDAYPPCRSWGGVNQHYWFRARVEIPPDFDGKRVVLRMETGRQGWDIQNPQFLLFVNGSAAQGIDVNHKETQLTENAKAGDRYTIDLYAFTGIREGYTTLDLSICRLETEVEKLYYNLQVPLDVCKLLDTEDIRRIKVLSCLNEAVNLLDLRVPQNESFYQTVQKANRYLEMELYGKFCGKETVSEICIGHTHLDVAWLWTLDQTREKAVRSFATVIHLMKQYPEYIFISSQPQLYEFVKEDRPELYEEIKKMVKAGRWEAEGAMWLEADCNLTSGESLIRQILFGKRFFRNEFGVDSKILWLPDVFGYSAALPQILKKSGVDYFMTTKISWNETNKLPYDTFLWRGLDGTEILTYFISTQEYDKTNTHTGTTYNGDTAPSAVKGCWQRYQQKEINTEVLNSYGYGDGGGGPTREMLERLARLNKGLPGCPKTKTGTALEFFRNLEKRVADDKRLPRWVGELYLEFHRGTYTSMARNKRYNRKTEFLNEDAEWLSSMNTILCRADYPREDINGCWKTALLNQFHDIIPGSAIKEVYEDSQKQYEEIMEKGRRIVTGALESLTGHIHTETASVVVFNPLSFIRSDAAAVELPKGWKSADVFDGNQSLDVQQTGEGHILIYVKDIPAKGYKTLAISRTDETKSGRLPSGMRAEKECMENRFFCIQINENGAISSLYDKVYGREVLQSGRSGNCIQAFEDKPFEYDAWNIESYYQEKMWSLDDVDGIEVVENGPVRAGVRVSRRFLSSVIVQTYYLYRNIPRIDFETTIDWKEKQILLKAAFPIDIHAEKATYEIQYGNVERPTHWNTSWDRARFEVCGHKWADLSEEGYGVSLLNDCKYGYDIRDSVMRLTLLKSATNPNEDADRERHQFTYSLYPHNKGWKQSGTAEMAYELNCPLYAVCTDAHEGDLPQQFSFIHADSGNVMIEVVKQAEDGSGTIIRLYEYKNKRTTARLTLGRPFSSVWECDLMENEQEKLAADADSFTFQVKPYEIRTFKVRF